jgi:hypothetical protein
MMTMVLVVVVVVVVVKSKVLRDVEEPRHKSKRGRRIRPIFNLSKVDGKLFLLTPGTSVAD